MSFVHIALVQVDAISTQGEKLPVAGSGSIATSETIQSSGTSQASTLACPATLDPKRYVWQITNGGDSTDVDSVPVYLVFGTAPTAVVGGAAMRKLLVVGETFNCHPVVAAEKVALINATIT
jgi:hypothetical protein